MFPIPSAGTIIIIPTNIDCSSIYPLIGAPCLLTFVNDFGINFLSPQLNNRTFNGASIEINNADICAKYVS